MGLAGRRFYLWPSFREGFELHYKDGAAFRRLPHGNGPAMGNDGARCDVEPKSGTAGLITPPLPEAAEDLIPLIGANARPVIDHFERRRIGLDHDRDGGPFRRVPESILNDVAERPEQIVARASDAHRLIGRKHLHRPMRVDCGGSKMRGDVGRNLVQVGDVARLELEDVEPGDIEKLIDEPLETADLLDELGMAVEFGKDANMRLEHGNRRPQLVRRIGNEAPLRIEGRLQSIETTIDGAHKSMDIGREPALGQTHRDGAGADGRSLPCGHVQGHQPDARHDQIDDEEDKDEGDPYPGDVLDEFLQHAVIDDIAGVEGDLDPHRLIVERAS